MMFVFHRTYSYSKEKLDDFLETTFGIEIKELAHRQGFSSARSLLHSHQNILDFLLIDSNDTNLIAIENCCSFVILLRISTGTDDDIEKLK
jgi:hypothetical protein